MKQHAIIPIFIPHQGCNNDCVFCNQKKITAKSEALLPSDIKKTIDTYLSTLGEKNIKTVELAFFGGSFTGIPIEEQNLYLSEALKYKKAGLIDAIHLSTRPDYIDEKILENLRKNEVSIIELGVQSFDDKVLRASKRGHTVTDTYKACELIKDYGFTLGIQLMIGLPEDSRESCIFSAKEAVRLQPSLARLYPTVILEDTELLSMYESGQYTPLSEKDAVDITKEMYKILFSAGIKILRVGLKSTDIINNENTVSEYHPAFRQLVEGEIAKEILEEKLRKISQKCNATKFHFLSNGFSFSNMVGNSAANKKYFMEKYPDISIKFSVDNKLENYVYNVVEYKNI